MRWRVPGAELWVRKREGRGRGQAADHERVEVDVSGYPVDAVLGKTVPARAHDVLAQA